MREAGRDALRVGFEGTIKLEFHGTKVSSDADMQPRNYLSTSNKLL